MKESSTDRIHKEITLNAPLSRVWKALTDSTEFGAWFGVQLEGPFQVGEKIEGSMACSGYEHLTFRAWVERMESEKSFAFRWQPQAKDPDVDYSNEPKTLVEFHLEGDSNGTLLTVTESGFDRLPEGGDAFTRNEGGWTQQVQNIKAHVGG